MKKSIKTSLAIALASTLVSISAFASWSADRTVTAVQVADACGTVAGQWAIITDNTGTQYWITSNADNFNNVVEMAKTALVHSRTVNFYARPESYTVQTQRAADSCFSSGTIANRLSILSIK